MNMPIRQRGFGKVEALAVAPEVAQKREKGHTFKAIHQELYDTGQITMSYKRFLSYFREYPSGSIPEPADKTVTAEASVQPGTGHTPTAKKDGASKGTADFQAVEDPAPPAQKKRIMTGERDKPFCLSGKSIDELW